MNVFDVTLACRRCWPLVLAALLTVSALAVLAYRDSSSTYTATSTIVVLPDDSLTNLAIQQSVGGEGLTNPFGTNAAAQLNALLAEYINSTWEPAVPPGVPVRVAAVGDSLQRSVYLSVQVVSTSESASALTLAQLLAETPAIMTDIQRTAGVETDQLYTAYPLDEAPVVESEPDRGKLLGGLAAAGLAATAGASVTRERIRERVHRATELTTAVSTRSRRLRLGAR